MVGVGGVRTVELLVCSRKVELVISVLFEAAHQLPQGLLPPCVCACVCPCVCVS